MREAALFLGEGPVWNPARDQQQAHPEMCCLYHSCRSTLSERPGLGRAGLEGGIWRQQGEPALGPGKPPGSGQGPGVLRGGWLRGRDRAGQSFGESRPLCTGHGDSRRVLSW